MKISALTSRLSKIFIFLLAFQFSLPFISPSHAAAPDSPTFQRATLQIVVDNDFAVFLGDSTTVTRLFYQNNDSWPTQLSAATSLDINPTETETYVYVTPMGGGGTEDFGGTLNGQDITSIPGAQYATGRSPLDSATVSSTYLLIKNFLSGYNSSDAANGVYNINLADMKVAMQGTQWSSAVGTGTGSGTPPNYKQNSGVCCSGSSPVRKGWQFPSDDVVIFRYPVTSLGLPVTPGNHQVVVDWSAPAAGATPTGYVVQYKKTSDPDSAFTTFSTTSASTTIETVTSLTNGVSYSFRVAATNADGSSPYSAIKTGTPNGPIDPPPAPQQPIPDPPQTDTVTAIAAATNTDPYDVIASGQFLRPITNIGVEANNITTYSWIQSNQNVRFQIPRMYSGRVWVTFYNGAIPLLQISYVIALPAPVVSPTPTPTPSAIASPQATSSPAPSATPTQTPTTSASSTPTSSPTVIQQQIAIQYLSGQSALTSSARTLLTKTANDAIMNGAKKIELIGYATSTGNKIGFDNLKLSIARAENIKKFLQSLLPQSVVITIEGKGAVGVNPANRRVEVIVK